MGHWPIRKDPGHKSQFQHAGVCQRRLSRTGGPQGLSAGCSSARYGYVCQLPAIAGVPDVPAPVAAPVALVGPGSVAKGQPVCFFSG